MTKIPSILSILSVTCTSYTYIIALPTLTAGPSAAGGRPLCGPRAFQGEVQGDREGLQDVRYGGCEMWGG